LTKSFRLLAPLADYGRPATDAFAASIANLQSSIDNSSAPDVLRLKLVGANPKAKVEGLDGLPGKSNYFIGNDPKKWRTNVPNYAEVKYKDVYPVVDLVYYGNQGKLEHDFIVSPGVDPSAIRFAVETGNSRIENRKTRIDPSGDLVIAMDGGEVRLHKPVVYQPNSDDNRQSLDGRFLLAANNQITFEVDPYDKSRPLVIDPVLTYSTYLGGSSNDGGFGIAVDSAGNAYVVGNTQSADFPTTGPYQATYAGGLDDAFVTKLNAAGSAVIYSTYLGGSDDDWSTGIAVDTAGSAYVTGYTYSTDFPTANALQAANAGNEDAFVTKLNAAGSALAYSTYLGGGDYDYGRGIAVDTAGSAYVAGDTYSTDFPTHNPLQADNAGYDDAFVTKLNAAGSALVYSTYLGGGDYDVSYGIAVDMTGNAYLTGYTSSTDFPTANAFQADNAGNDEAFLTKLNAAGSVLVYSTYLGGSDYEYGYGIAVDTTGNAYLTGYTGSTDFPTANPLQAANATNGDAFVTKLNPAGSALAYSTYLGGSGYEHGNAIAVDTLGNAYVTGDTYSTDFPTVGSLYDYASPGLADPFIAKITFGPAAALSATNLAFDDQLVGTASTAKTVTLTNTGDSPLTVSVAISGTNASDFTKTTTCGSTLAALGSCTIDVTFTPSATGNRSATLTVTGTAVALTGTGTDFGLGAASGGSTSKTVSAGGTATFNLQVTPTGFSGPVTLACAFQGSTPRGASCSVSPSSVTVNGTDPAAFTVSVTTTARALATPQMQAPPPAGTDWGRHALPLLMALVMLAMLAAKRRAVAPPRAAHAGLRSGATGLLLAGTLLVVLVWAACGGGGGGGTTPTPTGTPAGTYTLTVTGTAEGANRTTGLTLTVS
jgi:hypothetical protein